MSAPVLRWRRSMLVLTFLATAWLKWDGNPARSSEFATLHVAPWILVVVTVVELVLAGLLCTRYHRAGLWGAFLFAVCATIYLGVLRLTGMDIETCGCFGSRRVGITGHFAMLMGMMMLSMTALTEMGSMEAEVHSGMPRLTRS